jgi:demethoxyubiquinone hydroxylase (CLK1/Coq7/Cat5 family)
MQRHARRASRLFAHASPAADAVVRTGQLASIAAASFFGGMDGALRSQRPDIEMWREREALNLEHTSALLSERSARPSVLAPFVKATYGIAGAALANAPPRIRNAFIGGVYESLSEMHVEHLRELLNMGEDASVRVKEMEKSVRNEREAVGAPEGSPQASPEIILAELIGRFGGGSQTGNAPDASEGGLDVPGLCSMVSARATSLLLRASKAL